MGAEARGGVTGTEQYKTLDPSSHNTNKHQGTRQLHSGEGGFLNQALSQGIKAKVTSSQKSILSA